MRVRVRVRARARVRVWVRVRVRVRGDLEVGPVGLDEFDHLHLVVGVALGRVDDDDVWLG